MLNHKHHIVITLSSVSFQFSHPYLTMPWKITQELQLIRQSLTSSRLLPRDAWPCNGIIVHHINQPAPSYSTTAVCKSLFKSLKPNKTLKAKYLLKKKKAVRGELFYLETDNEKLNAGLAWRYSLQLKKIATMQNSSVFPSADRFPSQANS